MVRWGRSARGSRSRYRVGGGESGHEEIARCNGCSGGRREDAQWRNPYTQTIRFIERVEKTNFVLVSVGRISQIRYEIL